jgi:hypothetical protein
MGGRSVNAGRGSEADSQSQIRGLKLRQGV